MPGTVSKIYIGGASGGRKSDSHSSTVPLGAPASSGARDFLELRDVPNSYDGQSGNTLIVNPGEDGLIFSVGGGGGGSSTFLGLTDSPTSYEGQGYKLLGVKSAEDGLEYVDADFAPTVHTHVEANITNLDKYTQAEVDSLIAGVEGGGGGESDSNTVVIRLLASDSPDTFERSIFSAPAGGCIIDNIRIVPDVAINGSSYYYCILDIVNKGTGSDNNSVVSLAFDYNSAPAFTSTDLGSLSPTYKDLDADDSLTLKKTITGQGMQTPDMIVVIDFHVKETSSSSG